MEHYSLRQSAKLPAHNTLYTSGSDPAGRRPRTCRSRRTPHRQSRPQSTPDSCGKKSGPASRSPPLEALLSLPAGAIVLHGAVVFAEEAALSVVDWPGADGGGHCLHIPHRSGQRRLGLIRPGLRVLQREPGRPAGWRSREYCSRAPIRSLSRPDFLSPPTTVPAPSAAFHCPYGLLLFVNPLKLNHPHPGFASQL